VATTAPVIVIVSPAMFGAPSLMATDVRIASGPAQSVMKRPTKPLVLRMFMKMSGMPRLRAMW